MCYSSRVLLITSALAKFGTAFVRELNRPIRAMVTPAPSEIAAQILRATGRKEAVKGLSKSCALAIAQVHK